MSAVGPEGRSYRPIERRHLERLLEIARADRDQFFAATRIERSTLTASSRPLSSAWLDRMPWLAHTLQRASIPLG